MSSKTVKFLVGPRKVVVNIERDKLEKHVSSLGQFNDNENHVSISVESFNVFVDMVNDRSIKITSPTIALDLVRFAEEIYCFQLHCDSDEYLKNNYECDRVVDIYQYAKTKGLPDLADNCLDYMKKDFKLITKSEYFFSMSIEKVTELVSSDDLNMNEVDRLKALVSYAKHQDHDIRSQMKTAVDKIRFEDIGVQQLLYMEDIDRLITDADLLQKVKYLVKQPESIDQTISIDYKDRVAGLRGGTLRRQLIFSEDVFLETIEIDDSLTSARSITCVTINYIKIPVTLDGSRITVRQHIKKYTMVGVYLQLQQNWNVHWGTISSKTAGVTIIPDLESPDYVALIKGFKVTRLDNALSIHWIQ